MMFVLCCVRKDICLKQESMGKLLVCCIIKPHLLSIFLITILFPGWYYPEQSSIPENTAIPLDIFKVRKGHKYRFRLNNGGLALTLRVSIDSHVMYVMSVDSFLVQSEGVESIMIAPGER